MARRIPISGVYAILGPNGVYVGEAGDCWKRDTLALAVALGWECGIVRELPGSIRLERLRAEGLVTRMFLQRGFPVVSKTVGHTPGQLVVPALRPDPFPLTSARIACWLVRPLRQLYGQWRYFRAQNEPARSLCM